MSRPPPDPLKTLLAVTNTLVCQDSKPFRPLLIHWCARSKSDESAGRKRSSLEGNEEEKMEESDIQVQHSYVRWFNVFFSQRALCSFFCTRNKKRIIMFWVRSLHFLCNVAGFRLLNIFSIFKCVFRFFVFTNA